jgi:hypothetical protein
MNASLRQAIHAAAARGGERGLPMGQIVEDALAATQLDPEPVELEVWRMLQEGLLVATGFVARALRRRDAQGTAYDQRSYEFLLAAAQDAGQLALRLPEP